MQSNTSFRASASAKDLSQRSNCSLILKRRFVSKLSLLHSHLGWVSNDAKSFLYFARGDWWLRQRVNENRRLEPLNFVRFWTLDIRPLAWLVLWRVNRANGGNDLLPTFPPEQSIQRNSAEHVPTSMEMQCSSCLCSRHLTPLVVQIPRDNNRCLNVHLDWRL